MTFPNVNISNRDVTFPSNISTTSTDALTPRSGNGGSTSERNTPSGTPRAQPKWPEGVEKLPRPRNTPEKGALSANKNELKTKFASSNSRPKEAGQQNVHSSDQANTAAATAAANERIKLVPTNKAMQDVLQGILDELLKGNGANLKDEKYAAVLAHLDKQLAPLDSGVLGVSLTGFSHIRFFDAVMPHDFVLTTTKDLRIQIIADSLAYAKHPAGQPPPNVFSLEQFYNNERPSEDPNIAPPGHTIHGKDCLGNDVVGLHAGPDGMTPLNGQYQNSARTSILLGKSEHSWEQTAWMAALMHLSSDKLENALEKKNKDVPENSKKHIEAIQNAAMSLQKARLEAAKLKKNGAHGDAARHFENATKEALEAISEPASKLTPILLASKNSDGRFPPARTTVRDRAKMMSLMSALGVPAITMRIRSADDVPINMMYHSADMTHAKEAFDSDDNGKKENFLAGQMKSVPVVLVGKEGYTLTFPEMLVESEDEKLDVHIPDVEDKTGKEAQPAGTQPESDDKVAKEHHTTEPAGH